MAYAIADGPAEDDLPLAEQLREARVPQRLRGQGHRPTRTIMDIRTLTVLAVDTFGPESLAVGPGAAGSTRKRPPVGIHHRAATSKRHRRPAGNVVLDARTLQAHVLTSEAVAAARAPGGRYVATCSHATSSTHRIPRCTRCGGVLQPVRYGGPVR
jgi:hypothetical protein